MKIVQNYCIQFKQFFHLLTFSVVFIIRNKLSSDGIAQYISPRVTIKVLNFRVSARKCSLLITFGRGKKKKPVELK